MKYGIQYAPTIVSIRKGGFKLFTYAKKEKKNYLPKEQEIHEAFGLSKN